jgi:hypothetical protein
MIVPVFSPKSSPSGSLSLDISNAEGMPSTREMSKLQATQSSVLTFPCRLRNCATL